MNNNIVYFRCQCLMFFCHFYLHNYVVITQLADTNNDEQFKNLMTSDEYDFRFSCGITKPTARFSDKQQIVNAMCLHYSVLVSLAELEQLRRGLAIQKFNSLMESYPQLLRKAFQPPQCKITSEYIQDLFVAGFSRNKRPTEEAIMIMWIRYLQYLEGRILEVFCMIIL